jgi:hypothetical protein
MNYYHATLREYKKWEIVTATASTAAYENATEAMDAKRPKNSQARKTALYCADSPEFAVYYQIKQGRDVNDVNLYQVKVDKPCKTVFAITNAIENKLNNNEDIEALIKEYWSPTMQWKVYEYLASSFEVVKKIDIPRINEIAMFQIYQNDFDLVSNIS